MTDQEWNPRFLPTNIRQHEWLLRLPVEQLWDVVAPVADRDDVELFVAAQSPPKRPQHMDLGGIGGFTNETESC